ncbi:MAG: DUF3320 domain-containing protein, partial [Candidatus Sericytochromatia bacterium]|nr:DUF3320 domain-containing protein [Candidatus Sericytochromatia bacterium]
VLESLGWKIHRIWSRDWVSNQVYEIEKIKEAIKQAISKGNRNDSIDFKTNTSNMNTLMEDSIDEEKPKNNKLKRYYNYKTVVLGIATEFHQENNSENISNLIYMIVKQCSPIHFSVLTKSVAEAWQMNKVSNKLQIRVNTLVKNHSYVWIDDSDFVWIDGMQKALVRLPGDVRDANEICNEEFAEAVLFCLKNSFSANKDELIKVVAKLYEFARTSENIRERISYGIDLYLRKGKFIEEDGLIKLDNGILYNNNLIKSKNNEYSVKLNNINLKK